MVQKIEEIFKKNTYLGPKELYQLAKIIKFKRVKKGEHIVKEGEFNYNGIKVLKGLLAHYIIDKDGIEKTLLFVPENRFSGSMQTTLNRMPADENIIALENSWLLLTDVRELEALANENIKILRLLNDSRKEIIIEAATRIRYLIANSPEERYLHFTKTYPNLEERIKQKHLASFLGVTVSSLSRIKSRLDKK